MMPQPCLGCANGREIPAPEGSGGALGHGASRPLPRLSPLLLGAPSTSIFSHIPALPQPQQPTESYQILLDLETGPSV